MPLRAKHRGWPDASLSLALGCLLCLAVLRCEAQNLVPNPSFEIPEDSCSWQCCFNVGSRPLHWYSWLNSPEHFNACAGYAGGYDTLVAVPQNGWTFQYPWDGNAYVGVAAYWDGADYREYVGAELVESLVVGCSYLLRFRTNPAYGGTYWPSDGACNNVGMLLTTSSNAWQGITGPPFAFRNFAHLRAMEPVLDTAAWTVVEGTFIADSAYAHVVLGNFFSDALTEGLPIGDTWQGPSFYLIDGVEVMPLDATCHQTGVEDASAVGPNMTFAAERITVDWATKHFKVEVLDMVGRVVHATGIQQGLITLPWPNVAGAYLVRVLGKESSFVKKFIVP